MKALTSPPNRFSWLLCFCEDTHGCSTEVWDTHPFSPSFLRRFHVFYTWQDSDRNDRFDSTIWAEVMQSDPANGRGSTGEIITVLKFYRNKKIHCHICLFSQSALARVSGAARRQGKPWRGVTAPSSCQYLKRVIKAHGRGSVKGNGSWKKPKDYITLHCKGPHEPPNDLLWLWQILPQMPSVSHLQRAV